MHRTIVVLVQVLQLVIVDVLLPNPGPDAVVEACFAMNLHKAVDVLCLHRMRFIGRQHLLHFVVFLFFFLHPVLQFQTFAGLLTKQCLLFM